MQLGRLHGVEGDFHGEEPGGAALFTLGESRFAAGFLFFDFGEPGFLVQAHGVFFDAGDQTIVVLADVVEFGVGCDSGLAGGTQAWDEGGDVACGRELARGNFVIAERILE